MKKLFTLLCILALSFSSLSATDYTVEPKGDGNAPAASFALPIFMGNSTNTAGAFYGSITQCIFLPSEFLDEDENVASEGEITDITFYYTARNTYTATAVTRSIDIYLMEIDPSISEYPLVAFPYKDIYDNDQNCYQSYFLYNESNKVGERVYNSTLSTEDVSSGTTKQVTLHLSKSFHYSGTKNLVMTVHDKTATTQSASYLRFLISSTKETTPSEVGHPRFAYTFWTSSSNERASWITEGNYNFSGKLSDFYGANTTANKNENQQKLQRSYVPKTTFTFSDEVPTAPDVPTGLAATPGINTASLTWNEASGATSYKLYHSTSADGDYAELASPTTNSYNWTSLSASTTYYVKVSAVNGVGESDLSDPISFTTQSPHIHDGITFEPWSNSSAMPTSGNYFLETDVELAGSSNVTLSGNLNLCLNGHNILTSSNCIIVPDAVTFAIYDNEGTGVIRGAFVGTYSYQGLISNNGTLSINGGSIINVSDEANDYNTAVYNNGVLKIAGAPAISGVKASISLATSKYITIESGKPLTNTTPYSVKAVGQTITSGWSNMGEANPANYFTSAKSGYPLVKLVDGEAKLVSVITLNEASDNSTAITDKDGIVSDIRLTRSLTSEQYNTFCLPFELNNAQLEAAFGVGYDLQEFESSSLVEETLELTFNKVTALVAGKPYLLKPSVDVANPIFPNVTITATTPNDPTSDTYISFYGIYSPTELEGGNKNILFLGAGNELFWPEATENLNGFRAYFRVKGGAAKVAKRARIINKEEAPTSFEKVQSDNVQGTKYIENGQLFILYNGTKYNVQGQVIK